MIKSSDNNSNNVYRIIKVLSNNDYLAIDQNDKYFIFSMTQKPPNNHQSYKLSSKSIYSQYNHILFHK